jgi:hypothetical protein
LQEYEQVNKDINNSPKALNDEIIILLNALSIKALALFLVDLIEIN